MRGGHLREMGLKGRTWQGKGSGGGTWKVKSRKAKGRDELTDGREATQEPRWYQKDHRRANVFHSQIQNFAKDLYQD